MAQRYLPAVRRGDKRILLLDGEPLGAVLRVPAENETRANLHVGGKAAKTSLDEHDRRIVEKLRPWLQRDGLFFVGIDVIGGWLTEVNVTSPTGIQEMNALDGCAYETRVLEAVEAKVGRTPEAVTSAATDPASNSVSNTSKILLTRSPTAGIMRTVGRGPIPGHVRLPPKHAGRP